VLRINILGRTFIILYLITLLAACGGSTPSVNKKTIPPSNANLQVSVGPDQTIVLADILNLNATVTENGQPPQGAVTYRWTQVSGPGIANFTSANTEDTSVTFTEIGSYVLNLMATTGSETANDALEITVNPNPPSNALQVDVGPDQTIVLADSLNLNATVTENGQPPQGTVTYRWTQLSGPGIANFGSANAKDTSVTFTEIGSYVLNLMATNGSETVNDSLVITVNLKAAGGSGLLNRPSNSTECVAPATPPVASSIQLSNPYPNLPNLYAPVAMYMAPGDSSYWYVVIQTGQVRRFENNAAVNSVSTFIDISSRVVSGGETGLLGMAFHPNFATNGYVYLSYTADDGGLVSRISRFTLDSTGQALDPASEQIILTVSQPYSNHNGGQIAFGPDGYLYIGFGDGGGGNPQGNSQNTSNLLGSVLRIDVGDGSSGSYTIPPDNPFVNSGGRPEIFAYGFRNPWRWTFDRTTGDFWLGDVGQDNYEEIDKVTNGGNYGWKIMEGTHCYNATSCDQTGLILPVAEYDHTQGIAVTGGYVYRGTEVPFLYGQYLYGDYGTGKIWALQQTGQGQYASTELLDTSLYIASFAEDHNGELYIVNLNGNILKITGGSSGQQSQIPNLLSDWGCFQASDITSFSDSVIPYNINALLWSDHADKGRFMAIPDNTTIDIDNQGRFDLPVGSVVGKNFRLNGKLIETRLLLHFQQPYGWKGYSYEWNDSETEATLLTTANDKDFNGQTWHYPSRAECEICHTTVAGFTLGPEIGQLNRSFIYTRNNNTEANQLITLQDINVLSRPLSEAEKSTTFYAIDDTAYSAERRARSYLHTNCAICHQPGGTGGGNMDLRMDTSLENTGICNVAPLGDSMGLINPVIVSPGDPNNSILVLRMENLGQYRMPPLATSVVDTQAVTVIREWISGLTECP
jgi:uncharacterized repeat protein (TIGR03806 family)